LSATPKRLSGSVSPDKPERNAVKASSIGTLLNEAMSAASSTNFIDIFADSVLPIPKA
jgi:hypothetical protein